MTNQPLPRGTKAIEMVLEELRKAEAKHPGWPSDKIHAVAIMIEEAGEAMQAAIDCVYAGGEVEHLRTELAQTGAMALRALINLDAAGNQEPHITWRGAGGGMFDHGFRGTYEQALKWYRSLV